MAVLAPTLRPAKIFRGRADGHAAYVENLSDANGPAVPTAAAAYALRAMVCYYGLHYAAFCVAADGAGPWTRFDDATVAPVGSWADLCSACARGRLQPTVLFYERVA